MTKIIEVIDEIVEQLRTNKKRSYICPILHKCIQEKLLYLDLSSKENAKLAKKYTKVEKTIEEYIIKRGTELNTEQLNYSPSGPWQIPYPEGMEYEDKPEFRINFKIKELLEYRATLTGDTNEH
jgi:hypothetical protein